MDTDILYRIYGIIMLNLLNYETQHKMSPFLRTGLRFITGRSKFKKVNFGKYKNLNKTAKNNISPQKYNRLLIFVVLYSLEYKIDKHAV